MLRVLAAGLAILAATAAWGEAPKVSGYYKSLLISSKTVFPAGERYTLDLNRLRLELKGRLSENAALDLQYDNEVLLGNYRDTAEFGRRKEAKADQYWTLDANYREGGSWYGRHRLYRGSITFSAGDTDLRLGRQRIAWGTGRFWSPLDLLNPLNPIALEREERLGVDAALLENKLGPVSRISAVYAPRHARGESSAALRWYSNAGGVDYSLLGGRFRREKVLGIDLAGQFGGAGVRAELARVRPETAPAYRRIVLAVDYAFANTLTLSGELYYNGAGAVDKAAYDFASLFAGSIQNVGRRYFGGYASYEITPLLKGTSYLVTNLDDRSRFLSPALVFSLKTDVDLTLGAQLYSGAAGSEYARFSDAYFVQLQWFF